MKIIDISWQNGKPYLDKSRLIIISYPFQDFPIDILYTLTIQLYYSKYYSYTYLYLIKYSKVQSITCTIKYAEVVLHLNDLLQLSELIN